MRAVPGIFGILVLAAAWLGPLPALVPDSFLAHMTMHVAVMAAAAPLLAFALAGTAADPVGRAGPVFHPLAASLLEFVVVWGWHLPQAQAAAAGSPAMLALEQASFLAAGLALWLSCFGGGDGARTAARAAVAAFGLFLTSMHMTLLGTLLALAPRALYAHGHAAVADQQLGGIVMLMAGGASYLAGGLYLTARILRRPAMRAGRSEHGPMG